VTVDDDGPGIPEELLDRIFTQFWRGSRQGGTGLGLFIVKGIIEAHGGTITAGHAPCGGARFRFTLPAAQPDLRPASVGRGCRRANLSVDLN
jgi:signal transduction histidine kinase